MLVRFLSTRHMPGSSEKRKTEKLPPLDWPVKRAQPTVGGGTPRQAVMRYNKKSG